MTQVTMTAPKRNVSNIGADVLHLASIKGELNTGPIMLAHTYASELTGLIDKVKGGDDDSIRSLMLEYWHATPEGEQHSKRYEQLKALGKLKTTEQKAEQATMLNQQNAVYQMLIRAVKTCEGVNILRQSGRDVTITRVANTQNTFACYVYRTATGEGEWINFSATQLQHVASATFDDSTLVSDIRIACQSGKKGAANANKGANGERIAPSKLGDAAIQIDTSLAAIVDDNGKIVAGPKALSGLHLLWARLDALMSEVEKQKARETFNAEAAKQSADDVKAEKAVRRAMKGKSHRKSA
jgi:hypothetical protein